MISMITGSSVHTRHDLLHMSINVELDLGSTYYLLSKYANYYVLWTTFAAYE